MAKKKSRTTPPSVVQYPTTIDFHPLSEALKDYAEDRSPDKVLWRFEQFSEFLENCMRDLGVARFTRDNVKIYPTGELLCVAMTVCLLVDKFMSDLTDQIVTHVDHPITEFHFEGKGNGVFATAHQAACEWLKEIFETHFLQSKWFSEWLSELSVEGRLSWTQLTATEQARFADIELELAQFEVTPRIRLAVQVRQERLKFLEATQPKDKTQPSPDKELSGPANMTEWSKAFHEAGVVKCEERKFSDFMKTLASDGLAERDSMKGPYRVKKSYLNDKNITAPRG